MMLGRQQTGKDIPPGKRRRFNRSSSAPSMKIGLNQFIPRQVLFPLSHTRIALSLSIYW